MSPTVSVECLSKPATYCKLFTTHTNLEMMAIYHIICSFLWSHRKLYTACFKYATVFPKTCKHTLMYTCDQLVELPFKSDFTSELRFANFIAE